MERPDLAELREDYTFENHPGRGECDDRVLELCDYVEQLEKLARRMLTCIESEWGSLDTHWKGHLPGPPDSDWAPDLMHDARTFLEQK